MSNFVITLDPGHVYGYNVGYDTTYAEGTKMFYLAHYIKDELEKYGIFDVYITRSGVYEDMELEDRGRFAANKKSNMFISLHSDGFTSPTAYGVSIFRSMKRPNSEEFARKYSTAVAALMAEETKITYVRGGGPQIREGYPGYDYYGVIRGCVVSSNYVDYVYLIEHGFHTNPEECKFLNNDDNLRALAKLEASLIYEEFSGKELPDDDNDDTTVTPSPSDWDITLPYDYAGYRTADDAANDESTDYVPSVVSAGEYNIFREYLVEKDDGSNVAVINVTKDPTGSVPGSWINPEGTLTYEVYTNINVYSSSSAAMEGSVCDNVNKYPPGVYYIYKTASNGSINISSDMTGATPGGWINPAHNVKDEEPEELELTPIEIYDPSLLSTAESMIDYLTDISSKYEMKLTCTIPELVYSYIRAGYIENIRWDIALCQALVETGYFTYGGQVEWTQNNFCGLGATNDGSEGASFENAFLGALAQMQHLRAYAYGAGGVEYREEVDPRFSLVYRGSAPYVEWLGAADNPTGIGWAYPGDGYGATILKIYEEFRAYIDTDIL